MTTKSINTDRPTAVQFEAPTPERDARRVWSGLRAKRRTSPGAGHDRDDGDDETRCVRDDDENIECVDARDPIAIGRGNIGRRVVRYAMGEGWVKRARKSVVSRELEIATRTRRRGSTVACDDAGGEEKKKKNIPIGIPRTNERADAYRVAVLLHFPRLSRVPFVPPVTRSRQQRHPIPRVVATSSTVFHRIDDARAVRMNSFHRIARSPASAIAVPPVRAATSAARTMMMGGRSAPVGREGLG